MTLPIGTNNINKKQQEQSLIKLLHYYDKTFCEYDICNNGPRNMMENIGTYGTHSSLNNPTPKIKISTDNIIKCLIVV